MKRKSIVTILAVVLMFVLSLTALIACDKEEKHEFSQTWSYDAEGHYHVCTVECHTDTDEKAVHTFDKGEITTPATENAEGVKTYTCTVCGYTKVETVAKLDHTHTFDTAVWEKDETSHWHPATCSHTNEKQGLEAHTFGEWTEKTPAGVHTDKVEHRFCSVCTYEETRTVENTATHTYATDWTKDETGHWHISTCEHETPLKADFANHTFGEWTITKAATTTSTGEKYRTCSTCGYKETAIIGMVQAYTIIWKNADGTILETDLEVLEGSKPEYNGATPTKVEDAVGSWEFKGWKVGDEMVNLSSYNITQNTTFIAEFEVDTYVVKFYIKENRAKLDFVRVRLCYFYCEF